MNDFIGTLALTLCYFLPPTFAISFIWLQRQKGSRRIGIISDNKTSHYTRIVVKSLKSNSKVEKSEIRNFQIQVDTRWYIDKVKVILVLKILDRMELYQRDLIQGLDQLVGEKLIVYYIVSHPSHSFYLGVRAKEINISKDSALKMEIDETFGKEFSLSQTEKLLKKINKACIVFVGVILMIYILNLVPSYIVYIVEQILNREENSFPFNRAVNRTAWEEWHSSINVIPINKVEEVIQGKTQIRENAKAELKKQIQDLHTVVHSVAELSMKILEQSKEQLLPAQSPNG